MEEVTGSIPVSPTYFNFSLISRTIIIEGLSLVRMRSSSGFVNEDD